MQDAALKALRRAPHIFRSHRAQSCCKDQHNYLLACGRDPVLASTETTKYQSNISHAGNINLQISALPPLLPPNHLSPDHNRVWFFPSSCQIWQKCLMYIEVCKKERYKPTKQQGQLQIMLFLVCPGSGNHHIDDLAVSRTAQERCQNALNWTPKLLSIDSYRSSTFDLPKAGTKWNPERLTLCFRCHQHCMDQPFK